MMNLSLILAAAATAISGGFDCQIQTPRAVSASGGSAIDGLPADSMKFKLELKGSNAVVGWPNSPIQMAGQQTVLPTGSESGMMLFISTGPCLFTETACGNMLNFARQPDGSLRFIITPSAIVTDNQSKARSPFLVLIEGRCVARKTTK